MAKSTRPSWAGKLRRQLKRAKEEDRGLSRFGADRHKYQLKPPPQRRPSLPLRPAFTSCFRRDIGIFCCGWETAEQDPSAACIGWEKQNPAGFRTTPTGRCLPGRRPISKRPVTANRIQSCAWS